MPISDEKEKIFNKVINFCWIKTYKTFFLFTDFIPWIFIIGVSILLFKYSWYQSLTFTQIIDLVKVIIWPLVAISAITLFRKAFIYLFFSLEEFNFFGAKGRLKPVHEMIREKADEMHRLNREKEDREKEFNRIEEIVKNKDTDIGVYKKEFKDLLLLYRNLNNNYKKIELENTQLKEELSKKLSMPSSIPAEVEGNALGEGEQPLGTP